MSVSVVKLLDGLGGEVVEVLVGSLGVEPGDPFGGVKLDVVDVAPGALSADQLVLERPDGGLGRGVVQSPTVPTEGSIPSSRSRRVSATDVYWAP